MSHSNQYLESLNAIESQMYILNNLFTKLRSITRVTRINNINGCTDLETDCHEMNCDRESQMEDRNLSSELRLVIECFNIPRKSICSVDKMRLNDAYRVNRDFYEVAETPGIAR